MEIVPSSTIQFLYWINIDILLMELLIVSYAFEYNSVFIVANWDHRVCYN